MVHIFFLSPLGPGHEDTVKRAERSVEAAMKHPKAADWTHDHIICEDDGRGRSATRNRLLLVALSMVDGTSVPDDTWVMWLDADDEIHPDFAGVVAPLMEDYDAIWGAIYTNTEGIRGGQQYPMTAARLVYGNPVHGVNIGYLIRLDVQRRFSWDESMDCGEDYKQFLNLWHDEETRCVKAEEPIYINNRGQHSKGPRAATGAQWRLEVTKVQKEWQ